MEFSSYSATLRRQTMEFCIGTPDGFIPPATLDFNQLSVEWYLNHSCDPNIGFDDNGDFIAIRDIAKGLELAYDYGFAESNPAFCMACICGSVQCRRTITGDDWKAPAFRARFRDYMLPRLRRDKG
jgi:SET domain